MRASLLAMVVAATLLPSTAHAADTKAECIAAADQGQSLRDAGKYRQARETFAVCARDACPKVVSKSCSDWLRDLDAATPTVVLGVRDPQGQDLPGVAVSLDGAPLKGALDGRPLPMDPGAHVLRFTRDGSDPAEERVVLRVGEKNREVTATLRPSALASTPAEVPAAAPDSAHGSSGARIATSLSMLVLGGVGIAAGGVLFGQSSRQSSTASGLRGSMSSYACTDAPSSAPCQQLGSAVDAQHRDATLGGVLVAGGGALVAGAIATWFFWPRSDASHEATSSGRLTVSPVVFARGEGLALGGAF